MIRKGSEIRVDARSLDANTRKRLHWVKLYEQIGNATVTCLKIGISKPTLRKWWRRYQAEGLAGLQDRSRRPKCIPKTKVFSLQQDWIVELRTARKLGVRRIQSELIRHHAFKISLSTIHKVLHHMQLSKVDRKVPRRKGKKRYSRKIPGETVQMDVMKVAPKLYQYTAIDDCTRMKIVALYPRKSGKNSLVFLERVIEELPFPIQRIQTDRGREFFSYAFQELLMEYHIKFRPIKPRSPHLNGKVERTQRTDLEEFYAVTDLQSPDLAEQLQRWQDYYNTERPHGSLNNQTPFEKWLSRCKKTPLAADIYEAYDPQREGYRIQDYQLDLLLRNVKRCG